MPSSNEYMRVYMRRRHHERRQEAIAHLGGCCVVCGTDRDLEIDHRDPAAKSFSLFARTWSAERFWQEVEKCQLLCQPCHTTKTVRERGQKLARGTHGTVSSYRYCKCDVCRKAWNDHYREYKRRRRNKAGRVREAEH